jgi:DNA processing protein
MKVNIHKLFTSELPECLTSIDTPPAHLYIAGQPLQQWIDSPKVAVVGSRKMTPYGRQVTDNLTRQLAAAGVVIISGLAYGIDAAAHQAALSAGGLTVAVLPTSINRIYPVSHQSLANQILGSGSLISEYGENEPVYKTNFTDRNRLVAALADVLLITEAAVNSGSLHTARHAMNQGKTVMSVPGNIDNPLSEGCNNLIKSGAVPVTDVSDIFFALGLKPHKRANRAVKGTDAEKKVYSLIAEGVAQQERLALEAAIGAAEMASVLTSLEINGYIKPLGSGNWTAVN